MISHVAGILAVVALAVPVAFPHPVAASPPLPASVPALPASVPALPASVPALPVFVPASVTWTVQPANAAGPDGRRWVEHTLDAGQVITEHLAVRNFGDAPATFALKAADGYLTDKGRFNMLPSDKTSTDGGTWISVRDTVTVPARGTEVVPFEITVPDDVTPGDHPAGIAATVAGRQGTVQVESRVGFRVLLRASGTLQPALTTSNVQTAYERSWNPLRPGTLHVTYTATNTGNVRLDVQSRARARDLVGATATVPVGELLPGGAREVTTRIDGVWGLGPIRTTVTFTPADDMPELTVTTWVVPWPQLLLAAGLMALALAARALHHHRRRRLEALLAQARREGARSTT